MDRVLFTVFQVQKNSEDGVYDVLNGVCKYIINF